MVGYCMCYSVHDFFLFTMCVRVISVAIKSCFILLQLLNRLLNGWIIFYLFGLRKDI